MKKIMIIVISLIVMLPTIVNAECTDEDMETYKKFSNNIKHNLVLEKDNTYTIKFLNIPDTLMVADIPGNIYTKNEDKKSGLIGDSKYNVLIMTTEKSKCPYTQIESRWIDLPALEEKVEKSIINKTNYLYFIIGGVVLLGIVFIVIKIIKNKKKSIL